MSASMPAQVGNTDKDSCQDSNPNYVALGVYTCLDLASPEYSFLCNRIPSAQLTCCSCGGGSSMASASPAPSPLPPPQMNLIENTLDSILTKTAGCRAPDGKCDTFWPNLISAAQEYGLNTTTNRFSAFVSTILHETDLLRTFVNDDGSRAGGFHLDEDSLIQACRNIPRLLNTMKSAKPSCSDPCSCDTNLLKSKVESKEFAFLTAAWWAARGNEIVLGQSHGCSGILESVDEFGEGSIHASCENGVIQSAGIPSLCQLTGMQFFVYCVHGEINDPGIDQRLQYFRTSQSGFDGQLSTDDGSTQKSNKQGKKLSTLYIILIAAGVAFAIVFLFFLYWLITRSKSDRRKSIELTKKKSVNKENKAKTPSKVEPGKKRARQDEDTQKTPQRRKKSAVDRVRESLKVRRPKQRQPPPPTFDESVDIRFKKPSTRKPHPEDEKHEKKRHRKRDHQDREHKRDRDRDRERDRDRDRDRDRERDRDRDRDREHGHKDHRRKERSDRDRKEGKHHTHKRKDEEQRDRRPRPDSDRDDNDRHHKKRIE